ncbi:BglG family transcription antiterminator [Clostridium estertheticum]|uniref:BglG family transcription antiterminator n=1 Tax=Clostridium estertheticum TaxID=238834 RepID=UPI001CF1979D|nr:BglG family transcription antiterminator [Clostridium estertheticum]MCB2354579.1 BglG family transcription antiterminator [Clostridium estertheticum]MCB2358505.1 BglG family transcription antiterminator [Clostridium estertheticum]WAG40827.1 BglG family transcription antiterminator [Clostridium estertheticum]
MNDKRFLKLFKILSNSATPMKSEEICEQLDIAPRTLRNDLKKYKSIFFENGVTLISKPGVGYRFDIFDQDLYFTFIQDLIKRETNGQHIIPVYPEERINYLIKSFLSTYNYIKIEDLEEELFVSRSTLTNDLKEVRERLGYYQLDIENKPNYGMKIVGEEFHKRACISKYYFYTDSYDEIILNTEKNENKEIIKKLLYDTITENDFTLTDIGFQNLVIYIMILLMRIDKITEDNIIESSYKSLEDEKEFKIACLLVEKLENQFKIKFPKKEMYYITIHLLGKKSMQFNDTLLISKETRDLTNYIFEHIKENFKLDFSQDFDLFRFLSSHFQPMMNRLKYGLYIENPLIDKIKSENHLAFEIALYAGSIIKEIKKYDVSVNEVGYIALHFALALERVQEKVKSKNIIVVCASGAGSSQILLYKLKQEFKNYINEIKVVKLYELLDIDQNKYDYIISTVAINFKINVPIINVQNFLTEEDVGLVRNIFTETENDYSFINKYFKEELFFKDLIGTTKEEVLRNMCDLVHKVREIPQEFYQLVIQREEMATTEFGNNIALPHPIKPITNSTFVAIGMLKKAMKWDKLQVKFIFLISTKRDSTESLSLFNESITALVFNKKAMLKLEKEPTLITLKDIIKEMAIQEKDNTIDNLFK